MKIIPRNAKLSFSPAAYIYIYIFYKLSIDIYDELSTKYGTLYDTAGEL